MTLRRLLRRREEEAAASPASSRPPEPLATLMLDDATLCGRLGQSSEVVASLHRTLYVFVTGFHEHVAPVLRGSSLDQRKATVSRLWRAYSLLAQELGGGAFSQKPPAQATSVVRCMLRR